MTLGPFSGREDRAVTKEGGGAGRPHCCLLRPPRPGPRDSPSRSRSGLSAHASRMEPARATKGSGRNGKARAPSGARGRCVPSPGRLCGAERDSQRQLGPHTPHNQPANPNLSCRLLFTNEKTDSLVVGGDEGTGVAELRREDAAAGGLGRRRPAASWADSRRGCGREPAGQGCTDAQPQGNHAASQKHSGGEAASHGRPVVPSSCAAPARAGGGWTPAGTRASVEPPRAGRASYPPRPLGAGREPHRATGPNRWV